MGMDVFGVNPDSEAGDYFRANVWSWRPIRDLIYKLCSDLVDEEVLRGLCSNGGAGPDCAETCKKMANRFEAWMEHHTNGYEIEINGTRVTSDGRFVTDEELAKNPEVDTMSPYQVHDDHLKRWIEFLRHCGGFEVW